MIPSFGLAPSIRTSWRRNVGVLDPLSYGQPPFDLFFVMIIALLNLVYITFDLAVLDCTFRVGIIASSLICFIYPPMDFIRLAM